MSAIRCAEDPTAFARSLFEGPRATTNLLMNAEFTRTDGQAPADWFTWRSDESRGTFVCADGVAAIRGARQAVVGTMVVAKPGDVFAARLRAKTTGGLATLSIGWKTTDGKWTAHARNARFVATPPPTEDGWLDIYGLVEVPPGAGQLVFMAGASGQVGDGDVCLFKDPALTPALTDE